jgi:hypothetical protein
MRLAYFLKWFFWSGITNAELDAQSQRARSIAGVPLYLVRLFARGVGGCIVAAALRRWHTAVDRAAEAAFAAGYAARSGGFV